MKAPEFTYDRGIATVTWGEPDHVELAFDSIRSERGDVIAEMKVWGGPNGNRGLLRRTRVNLCSPRSATEEAKFLSGRMKEVDWTGFFEVARWKVIDAHRQGRPAINLWDAVEPVGGGLLLPPLLVRDDPVIIFGDGGDGKSYLGLALALSIQIGKPLVGYLKPLEKLRVAYLDWEWTDHPHKRRMRKLLGDDPEPVARLLKYIPCQAEGPLVHQVDRLRRLLHEYQIQYIVIDSVALACAGKPEDAEVALAFFQALSRLEVGSALLAHVNRLGDMNKPFGSAFWHNSARLTWNIQKQLEASDDQLRVSLFNRKVNEGPLHKPMGLEFEFGQRTLINCAEVSDQAAKRRSERSANRLRDRLRDLLSAGEGCSYEEAASELNTSPAYIRKITTEDLGRTFEKFPDPNDKRITRLRLAGLST